YHNEECHYAANLYEKEGDPLYQNGPHEGNLRETGRAQSCNEYHHALYLYVLGRAQYPCVFENANTATRQNTGSTTKPKWITTLMLSSRLWEKCLIATGE
ncbi:unnamed protein product, partial [marine sediment metagenome]